VNGIFLLVDRYYFFFIVYSSRALLVTFAIRYVCCCRAETSQNDGTHYVGKYRVLLSSFEACALPTLTLPVGCHFHNCSMVGTVPLIG